jgi:transcriptional regulator with XRE-family HTH domain
MKQTGEPMDTSKPSEPTTTQPLSLLDEIEANPIECREMSAAGLNLDVISALGIAFARSGLTQAELAEVLGVSEETVQRTLDGDVVFHTNLIARYLRAMGFELHLELIPVVTPGLPNSGPSLDNPLTRVLEGVASGRILIHQPPRRRRLRHLESNEE